MYLALQLLISVWKKGVFVMISLLLAARHFDLEQVYAHNSLCRVAHTYI